MAKCKNCKRLEYKYDGKKRYAWCPFICDNPDLEFERYCGAFKKMTNADRIRAMTDEELAEHILSTPAYETCIDFCKKRAECNDLIESNDGIPDGWCKECLLEWLQKEVE